MDIAPKLNIMRMVPLLSRLTPPQLRVLAEKSEFIRVAKDAKIIEEGDMGDDLYIIITGEVNVTKSNPPYDHRQIAVLRRNDFFGEIALLRNVKRTARITAKTPCELLVVRGRDFVKSYQNFPAGVRDDIQMIIAKRLKELNQLDR